MPRVAITIPGKNSQPYRFKLDRKKVTIGRSSDNDIVVDCPSVSSLHCTMERVPGGYILRDRQSTNGMKLDGDEMVIIDLRNDSDVRVGDVRFEYTLTDDELDDLDDEDFAPHAKSMSEAEEAAGDDHPAKPAKKKKRAKVVTPAAARPVAAAPPVLASTTEGNGFFYGLALFVCGFLAFYGGLNGSYSGKQEDAGRKGEFSLLSDMKNGRPPLPAPDEAGSETP